MNRSVVDCIEKNTMAYRWCIAAILLLAAAVRVIHLAYDTVLSRDGITYIMMCRSPHASFSWIPPLYFSVMKLLHACGLSWEAAGLGISLTAGVILIIPAMKIAECCFQKRIWAMAFGILIAISPKLIDLSIEVQRDSLYLLESALAIWAILNGLQGKKIHWGIAGFLIASAVFTRIEALEFIGIFCVLLTAQLIHKSSRRRELMYGCALFWAVFLATMLIYAMLLEEGIGVAAANFYHYVAHRKSVARWL